MPSTAQQTKQKDNIPKNPKTQFDQAGDKPPETIFPVSGFLEFCLREFGKSPGCKGNPSGWLKKIRPTYKQTF